MTAKNDAGAKTAHRALKWIVSALDFTPLTDLYAELIDDNTAKTLTEYKKVQKQYRQFCDIINQYKQKRSKLPIKHVRSGRNG